MKNFYGTGFRIKIFKNCKFDNKELESTLRNYLDNFVIEINVAAEICISIPFSKAHILANLLKAFDENKDQIGMETYSIASSTMEEVFLKYSLIFFKFKLKNLIIFFNLI